MGVWLWCVQGDVRECDRATAGHGRAGGRPDPPTPLPPRPGAGGPAGGGAPPCSNPCVAAALQSGVSGLESLYFLPLFVIETIEE